jgi:hypothetical protein
MNRIPSHLEEVNLIGKLADLKDRHYTQSVLLTALIELLIDKDVFTAQELKQKTKALDTALSPNPGHPIS